VWYFPSIFFRVWRCWLTWPDRAFCSSWSLSLERSADGPQTSGLVIQLIPTVPEDLLIWAVGPQWTVDTLHVMAAYWIFGCCRRYTDRGRGGRASQCGPSDAGDEGEFGSTRLFITVVVCWVGVHWICTICVCFFFCKQNLFHLFITNIVHMVRGNPKTKVRRLLLSYRCG